MSKRPPAPDPTRLQGIPRIKLVQKGLGEDATDALFLGEAYRLILDPWQAEVLQAWLARRRNSKWTHKRCGLAVPRQNGKNAAVEVRELYGLIILGEAIIHTAHEIKTSRKAFLRLIQFFGEKADDPNAKYPDLNALVKAVRKTNGQEAIFLKDLWKVDGQIVRSAGRPAGQHVEWVSRGGFIEFSTRTGGGGRGTTYDLLIIDESQHLSEEDLEAIRPVISSAPLGNSQIIYLGTPPDPEKLSEKGGDAWVRIRASAGAKDLAWIEYGAPDGPRPDIYDTDLLYQCNPSLGVVHGDGSYGLDFETIEGEFADLTPDGVARERFGWWGNPEAKSHRGVIDMDQWRSLLDPGDTLPTRGLIVVDCSPDLDWTSIAVATDGSDGRPLGLVDRHEGTHWAVEEIVLLCENLDTVFEVALTPSAKVFSAALTKAGIPLTTAQPDTRQRAESDEIEHRILTSGDVGAACTSYQRMIREGSTLHVTQPELDQAARQAITKYHGDTQQWDRRNKKIDISPLVAISVAVHRWALELSKPPAPPPPSPVGISQDAPINYGSAGSDPALDWNNIPL